MDRVTLALVMMVSACGYPQPTLTGDDGGRDSSAASLNLTVSPAEFVVHPGDMRLAQLTVTNNTMQASGTPSFLVSGLTLGDMSISAGTCTTGLAPGASCTATGHLMATTVGKIGFDVTASAGASGTATAAASVTIRACASTCGPNATTNCCQSSVVPGNAVGATLAGATFYRGYDVSGTTANSMAYPATVSDSRLDTYEVTVGRFRAFVTAQLGTQSNPPADGAGAHSRIPDSGWDPSFNTNLIDGQNALSIALKCNSTSQTWTDNPGANESLPITCVTWFEAMAFCAWDGGFLPTEAEWNYAAAGGSEQRAYPWSSPAGSLTIDCAHSNYTTCVATGANRVGSESITGDGVWGQADLAGNVFEWTLDWAATYSTPCDDCANLTPGMTREFRGGSFGGTTPTYERTAAREGRPPITRLSNVGVRCGRAP